MEQNATDLEFSFTAELWAYTGSGSWHFLTLPQKVAQEIKFFREKHFGFGTVRVKAVINDAEWSTSIFPDKKSDSFLLPVKTEVRKKQGILIGDQVTVKLYINL